LANGLNNCQFIGNLGADPELRSTTSGHSVLKFRIACTEAKKVGDHWEDHVEWVQIVVWGKRAEGLSKFLAKGMTVYVSTKVRNSSYEDRKGVKRYKTEFVANEVIVFGGRRGGEGSGDGGEGSGGGGSRRRRSGGSGSKEEAPSGGQGYDESAGYRGDDDDIPF
jgi:single-strand DNA-binding protein